MRATELLKAIGIFAVVLVVILAGTFVAGTVLGSNAGPDEPSDGERVDGQSPRHYQPSNVIADSDAEEGEIEIDVDGEDKRVLVDSSHSNQYSRADLEPVVEALVREGHTVRFETEAGSDGFGESGLTNATLQRLDALLVVQPTESFSDGEIAGLEAYAEGDGRIVVLGEPARQTGGLVGGSSTVQFGAGDLTTAFGLRIGASSLYNLDDDRNDNNYESVYGTPAGDSALTDGVDRVQFDEAGYLVRAGESDARIRVRAVEGTQTRDRRETGQFPVAAQNGNFVLVADTSFLDRSELYDVDNEVFVGNLLEFMVGGDKDDDVPQADNSTGFGSP